MKKNALLGLSLICILFASCHKTIYDNEFSVNNYMKYSGNDKIIKDVIHQLNNQDTIKEFYRKNLTEDTLVWDKANIQITLLSNKKILTVPYIGSNSKFKGFIKIKLDTAGKFNNVMCYSEHSFINAKSENEKLSQALDLKIINDKGFKIDPGASSYYNEIIAKTQTVIKTKDLRSVPKKAVMGNGSDSPQCRLTFNASYDYGPASYTCSNQELNNIHKANSDHFIAFLRDYYNSTGIEVQEGDDAVILIGPTAVLAALATESQLLYFLRSNLELYDYPDFCSMPPPQNLQIIDYYARCNLNDPSDQNPETPPTSNIQMSVSDRLKYPEIANIIDNLKQKAIDDPDLMDALQYYSNLSREQILSYLTPGAGPKLKIAELNESINGNYHSGDDFFVLNSLYAERLNTLNSQNVYTFNLFLTSTILHEFIHFGNSVTAMDYPNDRWGNDAGKQFENSYFGGDLDYDVTTDMFIFRKLP